MDVIFKEYELSIKENDYMLESAMTALDIFANEAYLLECEGYVASDDDANNLFLEEVAKFMDKIKLFFTTALNKIRDLFVKVLNKFNMWTNQKGIDILVKTWKNVLSDKNRADKVHKSGKIKVLNQTKLVDEYDKFLSFSIDRCKTLRTKKYDNIDDYLATSEKIRNEIFDKMDNLKKSYDEVYIETWINNDDLINWKNYAKNMLSTVEKTINEIKTYACSEDDMSKIKDYQKITSLILSSFSKVTKYMINEISKSFNECNSILKKVNKETIDEIKKMKSSNKSL